MTMERVREAITFNADSALKVIASLTTVGRRVTVVVAHIGTIGLSLETDRWMVARGESRGFSLQPKGT